jgi:hypothetical protein
MRGFVFGVVVGVIGTYLYLQGFGPIVNELQGYWVQMSRPHAAALQQ